MRTTGPGRARRSGVARPPERGEALRYVLRGNRKADLDTPVEHDLGDGNGPRWHSLRELHEAGAIVRVRAVTMYNRVYPEYCADTKIDRHEDGREKGATYIPVYRRTHDALLATGLYDRATGLRLPDEDAPTPAAGSPTTDGTAGQTAA